jgi:CubicO group peptidase (beta-lactamase class C family)
MDTEGFRRDWFSRITARMALSRSSGIQGMGLKRPVEMLFEPGTRFHYSSHGIEYLRWVVEYLKGARIDTLVQDYVFRPLGMNNSSLSWRDDYASNSAAGHDKSGATSGSIERFAFPTAQATLYTSAGDYATFLAALVDGRGLKNETFAQMTSPQVEANPDVYWGWGSAWREPLREWCSGTGETRARSRATSPSTWRRRPDSSIW